jgi:hypothetical protein
LSVDALSSTAAVVAAKRIASQTAPRTCSGTEDCTHPDRGSSPVRFADLARVGARASGARFPAAAAGGRRGSAIQRGGAAEASRLRMPPPRRSPTRPACGPAGRASPSGPASH